MTEPAPYPLEQNVIDVLFKGIGSRFNHWLLFPVYSPEAKKIAPWNRTLSFDWSPFLRADEGA